MSAVPMPLPIPDSQTPPPDVLCLPVNGMQSADEAPEAKANILIVDDRPDKLLALEAVLSDLGQNLVQVRSGNEALRQLLKTDFAVILLDVSMPGMDGFETAALIRQRPSSEHTPIIFITSIGASENHIARGYSLGAVDYLLTPIVPDVLRAKVMVFVELHRKTELIKDQAERLRRLEETRHQRELAEVADRLEAETQRNRFFTLAPDLLAITGFDTRFIELNPSWERVLGYSPEELKNTPVAELADKEERPALEQRLREACEGSHLKRFEARYRHKNGSPRWLACVTAPFPAENLVYIFARDITARKQAEAQVSHLDRALEQQVAALTTANRELEAFNYSIAHDLRTPLRSMSGFARALLEDESANLSSLGLEYARRIAQSAKYMDTLLLDLLAYSRLTRTEMSLTAIALDEPVAELLVMLDKEIRDRDATVEVASPLGEVQAHLPTLKQIVSNLISNGLKFTAADRKPNLRIFTSRQGDFVRLWVEDNGIGIASEHQQKVFGLFQRLHDTQIYPGTGIGLALVRKGAERMGGRAGVESELGRGSRFWVDLPARKSESDGTQDTPRGR